MSRHKAHRLIGRITLRRPLRGSNRSTLRGHRRGPDDLSQALTAFGRAIRAHRRLARLAPSFFDSAVRDRETENRAERRRWMATWEPYIARAYGVEPRPPGTDDELPRLPSVKIQREVDLKLAEREMCIIAGREAMERYQQRQPHAVMSWSRMVRLLKIGFDFGNLACGLDSPNRLPEKIAYDYELTDLKRAYGQELETPAMGLAAPVSASSATVAMDPPIAPVPPPAPPEGSGFGPPGSGNPDLARAAPSPPVPPRSDVWSRWARFQRRRQS